MSIDTGDLPAELWLGRQLTHRMRLPGPDGHRSRPARIGSLASSSRRFADSLTRSAPARRTLQGPSLARVHTYRDAGAAPPRWWHPSLLPETREADRTAERLPTRGLPRAVRRVPNEHSWTPGGILGSLTSQVLPVRRNPAVTAAGPMLMQRDTQQLVAASHRRTSPPAPPAGPAARPGGTPTRHDSRGRPDATPPPAPRATPDAGRGESNRPGVAPGSASNRSGSSEGEVTTARPDAAPRPHASRRWQPERVSRLRSLRPAAAGELRPATTVGATALTGVATSLLGPDSTPWHHAAALRSAPGPLRRMVGRPHGLTPGLRTAGAPLAPDAAPVLPRRAEGTAASGGRHHALPGDPPRTDRRSTPGFADATRERAGRRAAEEQHRAERNRAEQDRAEQSRFEQRRAEQDRAEQSRFEQSRAEQHRAAQHTDAEQGRAAPPAPTLPTAGRHRMADGAPERSGGEGARPTDPRPSRAEPSAPRGIGLTTPRSLRHLGRPRDGEIRPALTVTLLPALAAAGHAWLPGAAGSRRPRPDAHGATPLLGGHRGAAAPPLEVRRAAHNPAADRPPAEYRPGHGPAGPGRRARSLAMTDLLASGRPLAIEGAPAPTRMGSAFAPAHEIAVRRSGAAAPAPPAGAGGATPDGDTAPAGPLAAARRRAAETAQHRAAATASPRGETARSASPETARSASPETARPDSPEAAERARSHRRRATAFGAATATAATALVPAPPPVSLTTDGARRAAGPGRAAPPVPAAARGLVPSHDGTLRRSLVDVTRGLLGGGSPGDASGAVGGAPSDGRSGGTTERDEGNGMPENHHLRVVRPEESLPAAPPPAASLLDDPVAMEELVDEVVQRIEARVINELERRGRRHNPGVF